MTLKHLNSSYIFRTILVFLAVQSEARTYGNLLPKYGIRELKEGYMLLLTAN